MPEWHTRRREHKTAEALNASSIRTGDVFRDVCEIFGRAGTGAQAAALVFAFVGLCKAVLARHAIRAETAR